MLFRLLQTWVDMIATYFLYQIYASNFNSINSPPFFLLFQDHTHTGMPQYRQDHSLIMRSVVHMTEAARSGIMTPNQLTTINQSQLSAQLGLNLGSTNLPHTSPSPPASKSATPSPSSSINEEDADDPNRVSYSMCQSISQSINHQS